MVPEPRPRRGPFGKDRVKRQRRRLLARLAALLRNAWGD